MFVQNTDLSAYYLYFPKFWRDYYYQSYCNISNLFCRTPNLDFKRTTLALNNFTELWIKFYRHIKISKFFKACLLIQRRPLKKYSMQDFSTRLNHTYQTHTKDYYNHSLQIEHTVTYRDVSIPLIVR